MKNEKNIQLVGNPHVIIIDTTLLCNSKCYFCWRSNKSEHLRTLLQKYENRTVIDFEIFKKIVDDVVQYSGIRDISLCGPMGEPLMNMNFTDLTEYVMSKRHFTTNVINTNGLNIHNHSINRLLNSLTEISVSVDSIDIETYKKIHGVPDLARVIKNIRNIIEYKKKNSCLATIAVRFTENEHNIGQYPAFKHFFTLLGVDRINYTKIHSFAGIHEDLVSSRGVAECVQGRVINFDLHGNMSTCCVNWRPSPRFGNIADKTIAEMWNSSKRTGWWNARNDIEPCKNCGGLGYLPQKTGLHDEA